jgi:hypothetical protein
VKVRHPTRRRLAHWLEHGEPTTIDSHLRSCNRCANTLEDLADPQPLVADALRIAFVAPTDLVPRINTRIAQSLRDRADIGLLGEMLGLPWQTADIMLNPDPET